MTDAPRADERPGWMPRSPLGDVPMTGEALLTLFPEATWMLLDADLPPNALMVALAVARASLGQGLTDCEVSRRQLAQWSGVPEGHVAAAVRLLGMGDRGILYEVGGGHCRRLMLELRRAEWKATGFRAGLQPASLRGEIAAATDERRRRHEQVLIPREPSLAEMQAEDGRRAAAADIAPGEPSSPAAVPSPASPAAPSVPPGPTPPVPGVLSRALKELRAFGGDQSAPDHPVIHNQGPKPEPKCGLKVPVSGGFAGSEPNREQSPCGKSRKPGVSPPGLAGASDYSQFSVPSVPTLQLSVSVAGADELKTDGRGPGGAEAEAAPRTVSEATMAEILAELTAAVGPIIMSGAVPFWREAIRWSPAAARQAAGQTKLAGREGRIRTKPGGYLKRCFLKACLDAGRPVPQKLEDWWRGKGERPRG